MKRLIPMCVCAVLVAVLTAQTGHAHCQIPCGIYGDETQFAIMSEHIDTIEKSMKLVVQLQSAQPLDGNQLVRWVGNKDAHADKLSEIVTFYFLAQRIKPVPASDRAAHAVYLRKVELLHQMLVHAMKAKQTTDQTHVQQLRALLNQFHTLYLGKQAGHSHEGHAH